MNFFMDTEFAETGGSARPTIDLISIGVVSEDGREFYAESSEFDINNCDDWVVKNVVAKLGPVEQRLSRAKIKDGLLKFLGDEPKIWAYFADYDWVVFCWIFGKMIDLPKGYPMFCRDLQQWWHQLGKPVGAKPEKPTNEHNALVDAKWNLQFYNNLWNHSMDKI